MTKLTFRLLVCSLLLSAFFLARPAAQIVPQIIQYFNGVGTSVGPIAITGQAVINGSLFVAGSGKGFGVGSISMTNTTPTLGAGWGGSPSVLNANGTFTFEVNVGTGGVATTGVVNLAAANAGYHCSITDITNNTVTRATSNTASSVTVTSAAAWAANDILSFICASF